MHPNSYYQVTCECGKTVTTETTKATCSCGRAIEIIWPMPAKVEAPKVTPIDAGRKIA